MLHQDPSTRGSRVRRIALLWLLPLAAVLHSGMKDVADQRPVVDYIWFHDDYRRLFVAAGLRPMAEHWPLGTEGEPWRWESELSVAPWMIYVLGSA